MAFEAARQFGEFTGLLSAFDPNLLHITLPDFHNLTLRFRQFGDALQNGNNKRIAETAESIVFLKDQQKIVEEFEKIKEHPDFKLRVVHHDAKINNVLFDSRNNRGLCVIDLDTVMPGYYISDVGDMLRTYICPVSEDEQDLLKIQIREEYFREIAKGYFSEMQNRLSEYEKLYFVYAGKFAIYMQALRFLTDYINHDIYYSIKYKDHNLVRANNQIMLLKKIPGKGGNVNGHIEILHRARIFMKTNYFLNQFTNFTAGMKLFICWSNRYQIRFHIIKFWITGFFPIQHYRFYYIKLPFSYPTITPRF